MITARLKLKGCSKSRYLASQVDMQAYIYKDGVLRVKMSEVGTESFSLTDHGIGVEE